MTMSATVASGLQVRKLSAALGAEVLGIDVRRVDAALFEEIRRAWNDHGGVLLFRRQTLEDLGEASVLGGVALHQRGSRRQPRASAVVRIAWCSSGSTISCIAITDLPSLGGRCTTFVTAR